MVALTTNNNSYYEHETQSLLPISENKNTEQPQSRQGACDDKGGSSKLLFVVLLVLLVAFMAADLRDSFGFLQARESSNDHDRVNANPDEESNQESIRDDIHEDVETTETYLPGSIPKSLLLRNAKPNIRHLNWGILGLGRIARDFTTALKMTKSHVTAVAAGSLPNASARAQAFADRYSVPKSYGSYQELADDPNVDIVYIGTINPLHYDNAMMMLKAGKNVLLEKPMVMKYQQAQSLVQTARHAGRLFVTNYWTRFFPVIRHVRDMVARRRRLGRLVAMRGDFGLTAAQNPSDRYLNKTQGGGAMLDLGCYLVNLAVMANPTNDVPVEIQATAQTQLLGAKYRVDTETSFFLKWNNSVNHNSNNNSTLIMSGQASFRRPSSFEVELGGTHGRVVIHGPANSATEATVYEYEPYVGPLRHVTHVRSDLPWFDESYGPAEYPRGAGFVYIIQAIEQCMLEKGIPGADREKLAGCLELQELSMEEMLRTAWIIDQVLHHVGYWDW